MEGGSEGETKSMNGRWRKRRRKEDALSEESEKPGGEKKPEEPGGQSREKDTGRGGRVVSVIQQNAVIINARGTKKGEGETDEGASGRWV